MALWTERRGERNLEADNKTPCMYCTGWLYWRANRGLWPHANPPLTLPGAPHRDN